MSELKASAGVLGRCVYHFIQFQLQGLTTGGIDGDQLIWVGNGEIGKIAIIII